MQGRAFDIDTTLSSLTAAHIPLCLLSACKGFPQHQLHFSALQHFSASLIQLTASSLLELSLSSNALTFFSGIYIIIKLSSLFLVYKGFAPSSPSSNSALVAKTCDNTQYRLVEFYCAVSKKSCKNALKHLAETDFQSSSMLLPVFKLHSQFSTCKRDYWGWTWEGVRKIMNSLKKMDEEQPLTVSPSIGMGGNREAKKKKKKGGFPLYNTWLNSENSWLWMLRMLNKRSL